MAFLRMMRRPSLAAAAGLGMAVLSHGTVASAAPSEPFFVRMELTGHEVPPGAAFTLEVKPELAPLGAARFRELVEAKFYDDQRFFRVLDGDYGIWIAQFGMHGDPQVNARWDRKTIPDDPVKASNTRGTLSFAMAGPGTRTTQLFLNFGDCAKVLDRDFAPFAEVVEGMAAVDAIYKVGEGGPGKGPTQDKIKAKGNQCAPCPWPRAARGTPWRPWCVRRGPVTLGLAKTDGARANAVYVHTP